MAEEPELTPPAGGTVVARPAALMHPQQRLALRPTDGGAVRRSRHPSTAPCRRRHRCTAAVIRRLALSLLVGLMLPTRPGGTLRTLTAVSASRQRRLRQGVLQWAGLQG